LFIIARRARRHRRPAERASETGRLPHVKVFQREEHGLMRDFQREFCGYPRNLSIRDAMSNPVESGGKGLQRPRDARSTRAVLFDIACADGIIPVLAVPEKPVPNGNPAR
jgi:hypothetical protein